MANKYAGTKTEKNLWEAFAGESQARNKYTYFASVAKKAGYEQIAALFLKTAENEKEHAKLWFKALGELGDTPRIFCMLHKARMLSGQICMTEWLKKQMKKDFRNWQHSLEVLQRLRKCMRKDIVLSFTMWKQWKCLKRVELRCGSAETVVML